MQKKEIITINGFPGSGKSSTADGVAEQLGFRRFSSGDFMRQIALDRGVSLNELSKKAETEKDIDISIDDAVRKAGEMKEIVIDSRLAFHWIPKSFKIYLDLSPEIAKERIANNLKINKFRQDSEGQMKADEVFKKIIERFESEKKRYKELYGIEHTDKKNFDLVVDTDKNNLNQVVDIIVRGYKKWIER
ncbi:AAA family ATPase [Candidatus Nomurabacteria bacterium]|nr:AAA family ATPase [Candidatus Nomurabacteria bacterium]